MQGYNICDACWTSASLRPIIWPVLIILLTVEFLETCITFFQYSASCTKSFAQTNSTFFKSIPQCFHTSIRYFPTNCIFSKSPPILLFAQACQSATSILNLTPVLVILL